MFINDPNIHLPAGGAANQILAKASAVSGSFHWLDQNWLKVGDNIHNTNSGKVGIGTDSPDEILHLHGQNTGIKISSSQDATYKLSLRAMFADESLQLLGRYGKILTTPSYGSQVALYSGLEGHVTERLRIDSTGKVGIGTDSPNGQLHVSSGDSGVSAPNVNANELIISDNANAGISILTPNANSGAIYFGDPEAVTVGGFLYSHVDNSLAVRVNNAERMRIIANGNVGIGTATPHGKLSVHVGNRYFNIIEGSSANHVRVAAQDSGDHDSYLETVAYAHSFFTDSLSRMTIDHVGHVGIGITHPQSALHVFGSLSLDGAATSQNYYRVAGVIKAVHSTSLLDHIIESKVHGLRLRANHADGYIRFDTGTSNAQRLRISVDGKVGIGLTPVTTPATKAQLLQVAGGINIGNGFNYYIDGVPISSFIDSAHDGTMYARRDGAWVSLGASAGTVSDLSWHGATMDGTIQNTGGTNVIIPIAEILAIRTMSPTHSYRINQPIRIYQLRRTPIK